MTRDQLKPGQSAYILSTGGSGALRHHLLDMGLTPKTEVTLQKITQMGELGRARSYHSHDAAHCA